MAHYPRRGQKTWYGRTKQDVLHDATLRDLAASRHSGGNGGDQEIAARERDMATYLRRCAERMADAK